MIVSICLGICIICLWIVIHLQQKDIDNLQESIHNLSVVMNDNVNLWKQQYNINESVTKFIINVAGESEKEKKYE